MVASNILRASARRIAILSSMLLLVRGGAAADERPQPNISVNGMCLERLEGWNGDYKVAIGKGLVLAPRYNADGDIFVLATAAGQADKQCALIKGHVIVSTLQMPVLSRDEWAAMNFDCFDRGRTVRKGQPIIATFNKATDQMMPTPAVKAWLVDGRTRKFKPVQHLACRSFS